MLWLLPLLYLFFLAFRFFRLLRSPQEAQERAEREDLGLIALLALVHLGLWGMSIASLSGPRFSENLRLALSPSISVAWGLFALLPLPLLVWAQRSGKPLLSDVSKPSTDVLSGALWFGALASTLAWLSFGLSPSGPLPPISDLLPEIGFLFSLSVLLAAGFLALPSLLPASASYTASLQASRVLQRLGSLLLCLLLLASLLLRWKFSVPQPFLLGATLVSIVASLLPPVFRASLFWILIQTLAILVWMLTQTLVLL